MPSTWRTVPAHYMTQTRYEIVSTIGVGTTSRVDKAHDTLIDRTVAMKTFGHGFGSEELQKQFMREAQILGRLSHPNIVSIYDLGTNEDGSAYLVMEFVPGKTLESVMAAQGALPLARVGVWAGDLANALHRAHRASIVHGDVKPANIFVTDEGHIKLGDFGIARYGDAAFRHGKAGRNSGLSLAGANQGRNPGPPVGHFFAGHHFVSDGDGVRPFDGSSVTAVCAQIGSGRAASALAAQSTIAKRIRPHRDALPGERSERPIRFGRVVGRFALPVCEKQGRGGAQPI